MKFTIAMLSLVLSVNVFAFGESGIFAATFFAPFISTDMTSSMKLKVQADVVIDDAQEMLQTGKVSVFLSQKIQEVKAQKPGLSDAEALDVLIDYAYVIKSK